jgi:hypothetical protein
MEAAVTALFDEATNTVSYIVADRRGTEGSNPAPSSGESATNVRLPGMGQRVAVDVIDGRKGPEAAGVRLI